MTARRRVDIAIGRRLRELRLARAVAAQQLAAAIGTSCEDLSDYESGRKRISAAVLYELAVTLAVPISYFFSDLEVGTADELPHPPLPC